MSEITKEITPENLVATSLEIIDYFNSIGAWYDAAIYVNGKRFSSDTLARGDYVEKKTKGGTTYYEYDNEYASNYAEYCNDDTITVICEGPLYDIIHYRDGDFLLRLSQKFLYDYGLYFDIGHAWSFSAYKS